MKDIVQWLRHIANFDTPQDPREGCRAAADEIERLRAALRETCRTFAIRGLNGDDKALAMHAIAREALDEY